eukprot:jgi/Astpho2/6085/e_gw1.00084.203.1_t
MHNSTYFCRISLSDRVHLLQVKVLEYPTLAFRFQYPVATASGRKLPMIFSRKPERYSSAAPLTADARQRVVAELVDFPDGVTVTMLVGSPSPALNDKPPEQCKARDIAQSVLIDRSTARITSGQRISLSTVENVSQEQKGDYSYIYYEALSQAKPTFSPQEQENFRHSKAVTSWRKGTKDPKLSFYYTLTLTCREEQWEDLKAGFDQAIRSFTMLNPDPKRFVSPEKDPWLFF